MITRLTIRNFKRFAATELQFRPLTVLTGLNGTGKSTAIQALLLARQSCNVGGKIVQLNGPDGLALGEAFDVLHPEATEQKVTVKITDNDSDYQYVFGIPDDRALKWHAKLEPHRNRIHFTVSDSLEGKILVGIFVDHLDT